MTGTRSILLTGVLAAFFLGSCGEPSAGDERRNVSGAGLASGEGRDTESRAGVRDLSVASYRRDLLRLAFESASKLPLHPHQKNRARAQEKVVEACLELGLLETAFEFIGDIANWRRGAMLADLAFALIESGATPDQFELYVDLAEEVMRSPLEEFAQAWRRDTIRAKIARCYFAAGDLARATLFEAELDPAVVRDLAALKMQRMEMGRVEGWLAHVEEDLERSTMQEVSVILSNAVTLQGRMFDEERVRGKLGALLLKYGRKMPAQAYVELMLRTTDVALDHGSRPVALEQLGEGLKVFERREWAPEDIVALSGEIAQRQARSGDAGGAIAQLDAAMAVFDRELRRIIDIYRAEALVPVAVGYSLAGDANKAMQTFQRAVTEAVHNPNSRPRVDDLVEICRAMALEGIEPTPELASKLRVIADELDDPW